MPPRKGLQYDLNELFHTCVCIRKNYRRSCFKVRVTSRGTQGAVLARRHGGHTPFSTPRGSLGANPRVGTPPRQALFSRGASGRRTGVCSRGPKLREGRQNQEHQILPSPRPMQSPRCMFCFFAGVGAAPRFFSPACRPPGSGAAAGRCRLRLGLRTLCRRRGRGAWARRARLRAPPATCSSATHSRPPIPMQQARLSCVCLDSSASAHRPRHRPQFRH